MDEPILIDVCIPTWNSAKTLNKCLESICREIPINKIRILDNFSTDDTVEIARDYGAVVIKEKCGLGVARQKLIESVTTEYFAFIDSDVILWKGWFKATYNRINSDKKNGAVLGLFYPDNPQDQHFWEIWYRRIQQDDPMWERGHLINTLLRTSAVKGIVIPKTLNNYEDKFIRAYIISKGYRWVISKEAGCDHLVGETRFWRTCLSRRYLGAALRLWKDQDKNISMKKFLTDFLREPTLSIFVALKAKDPIIIPFRIFASFFLILGYLGSNGKKMKKLERRAGIGARSNKWAR